MSTEDNSRSDVSDVDNAKPVVDMTQQRVRDRGNARSTVIENRVLSLYLIVARCDFVKTSRMRVFRHYWNVVVR